MNKYTVSLESINEENIMNVIGYQDKNLKVLQELFDCDISYRDLNFYLECDNREKVDHFTRLIDVLLDASDKGIKLTQRDIIYAYRKVLHNEDFSLVELNRKIIGKTNAGKLVSPKTIGQLEFVEAMERKDIVFAIGPAGTGKTYLAVVYAVEMLKKGRIKKIVLTRPAVEAGENLGFLPGDLKEKVDPYLIPLYDALYELLSKETTEKYLEKGIIEVAPLAYMRGRTLEDAFVILDEAQNTTSTQMKMFLTRLGFNSKMVITGDITQIDLNSGRKSGLTTVENILSNIEEIQICNLTSDDVIRHPLVQKIIERYEGIKLF